MEKPRSANYYAGIAFISAAFGATLKDESTKPKAVSGVRKAVRKSKP